MVCIVYSDIYIESNSTVCVLRVYLSLEATVCLKSILVKLQ